MKQVLTTTLLAAGMLGLSLSSASAATLLTVDLSTVKQITITATDGQSASTVSGDDGTGFYLQNFFSGASIAGVYGGLTPGNDLTSNQNTSNGQAALFGSSEPTEDGLNVWNYTDDATSDFISGTKAFSGSATWVLSDTQYAAMLGGPVSGSIFFPADSVGDFPGPGLLGEWEKITPIPIPAALPLLVSALGLFGLLGWRRQRLAAA